MSESSCSIIAVKRELVMGTAPAGTYYATEFQNSNFTADTKLLTRDTINGKRGLQGVMRGPFSVGGSVQMLSNPEGIIPRLLNGLLGTVVTTALGGGAYSHVFSSINCAPLPTFTVFEDKLSGKFRTVGTKVASMNMASAAGDIMKMNFALNGIKQQEATTPTISNTDTRPFNWADGAFTLNGASNFIMENVALAVNNNLTAVPVHNNSIFPLKFQEQGLSVTGSFSFEFDNMVEYRRFWGAPAATEPINTILPQAFVMEYVSPDQIGVSGQYYTISINLPAINYDNIVTNLTFNGRIMEECTFTATQDPATDTVLEITVINGESSLA